jgi:hypothetical protein
MRSRRLRMKRKRKPDPLFGPMNTCLGQWQVIQGLAMHPDCTDTLLKDVIYEWCRAWTQKLKHEFHMNVGQIEVWLEAVQGKCQPSPEAGARLDAAMKAVDEECRQRLLERN